VHIPHGHLNRPPSHHVHEVARPESPSQPGGHGVANGVKDDPVPLTPGLVQPQVRNGGLETGPLEIASSPTSFWSTLYNFLGSNGVEMSDSP
jgi:hypothetical protein